ncbi:MAG: alpha/beta hydrolase [Cyclobacteriaceae bacterium]
MKSAFFGFLLLLPCLLFGQVNVYFFPGQGSDYRIYRDIELPDGHKAIFIDYPTPERNVSLQEFAHSFIAEIDTSTPYIFIGQSIGGMIATELADTLHPQKVIILSSAKQRSELPPLYRFMHHVPINDIVPKKVIKGGALIAQPLVEPDRNKEKETFKAMLSSRDAAYLKRTVDMIINWERDDYPPGIIHIHGAKDHTLPIANINCDYVIEGGSHMMALTRAREINAILRHELTTSL